MNQVRKALAVLALTHSKQMSQEMADFYIESFEGKDERDVLAAIKKCAMEIRVFPCPADIHARMKTDTPDEFEIMRLVFEAIELHGYPNPEKAKKHIGEIGWQAVLTCGGWLTICNTPERENSILRAQLRGAALGSLNRFKMHPDESSMQIEGIKNQTDKDALLLE